MRMATALKLLGAMAFALAALSIVDMFLPRPYDGVVLESDAYSELRVRQVVPGTGAAQAGIRHGDVIVGIGREILRSPASAARQLNRYRIGEIVPYLIRDATGIHEVEVRLGHRQIGDRSYLYACLLGFSFFFVGLFVLRRHPAQHANQLFFILCTLFMLFLICRLRPASYSQVDTFVLATGTMALVVLPSAFLDFYLSFPRPRWRSHKPAWLPQGLVLAVIYGLPPLVLLASLASSRTREQPPLLISGAPAANWWILAVYMILGLLALGWNAAALKGTRERRGAWLVLAGSLFGLGPFLVLAVAFPSLLHTERFLFYGVVPLLLVPLTFAYSIVRFQLLDIQVILKKSLLYTVTTATLTALYAVAIASFNSLFGGTALADSRWSPIVLGLAIVLLFDPVRRRLQVAIDRFFAAERSHLQRAMVEMGGTFTADDDLQGAVLRLVERLPLLVKVDFAALYLKEGERLSRVSGPSQLPSRLDFLPDLHRAISRTEALPRVSALLLDPSLGPREELLLNRLASGGAAALGSLASSRRILGLLVLSKKSGQIDFEPEELALLHGLLQQAAIGLETNFLLEERTRRIELDRDLEIAASIQSALLPKSVEVAEGWSVAAACRPARQVGGDFIAKLPTADPRSAALAYGDVSGKSIPGALMMMAAHEILHALAMTASGPCEVFSLANQRLYQLRNRSFVALGYLSPLAGGNRLRYLLAGQPPPLLRSADGIRELDLPPHRLPLGALLNGSYQQMEVSLAPGDLVLGYSDGVVEALSPENEMFGSDRLADIVSTAPQDPANVVASVLEGVTAFTHGQEPYDDLTLICCRLNPEITP